MAEEHIKAEADLESIRQDIENLINVVRTVEGYNPGAGANSGECVNVSIPTE